MKKIIIQLLVVLALIGFSGVNAHATDCVWCKHQPNLSLTNTQSATSVQENVCHYCIPLPEGTVVHPDGTMSPPTASYQRKHRSKKAGVSTVDEMAAVGIAEVDAITTCHSMTECSNQPQFTQGEIDATLWWTKQAQIDAMRNGTKGIAQWQANIRASMVAAYKKLDTIPVDGEPMWLLQYEEQMDFLELQLIQKENRADACIRGIAIC